MQWARPLTSRAKQLRRNETPEEKLLWRFVRRGQLEGFKFRRQHPIMNYIADFACHEAMLIVELDGGHHAEQQGYDILRDRELEELGWLVLRFENESVRLSLHAVLETILTEAQKRARPLPGPLPSGGEGER
jgi:very-short-patch-repair endonuclease